MKDVCLTCSAFDKSLYKAKDMVMKQENHRQDINAIRKYRDDTKNINDTDKTMAATTFGLQDVLPLPKTIE